MTRHVRRMFRTSSPWLRPIALKEARANKKGPTLIEFIIEDEDLVMPMIKPGGAITDLITEM